MNIVNFKYSLVNAFLPIIIICFFLLDSLLHRNVKGLVFLIGLSFSIMATIFVGNSFGLYSLKGKQVDMQGRNGRKIVMQRWLSLRVRANRKKQIPR